MRSKSKIHPKLSLRCAYGSERHTDLPSPLTSTPPGSTPDDSHRPVRPAAKYRSAGNPSCLSALRSFPRLQRIACPLPQYAARRTSDPISYVQFRKPFTSYHVAVPLSMKVQ